MYRLKLLPQSKKRDNKDKSIHSIKREFGYTHGDTQFRDSFFDIQTHAVLQANSNDIVLQRILRKTYKE